MTQHNKAESLASEMSQVVAFRLGDETYGIDILFIQEVLHLREVTVLPNAPHFIQGVIELRGGIIPVVDLHRRLNLPGDAARTHRRIIVVDLGKTMLGLLVDDVHKVLRIASESKEPVPAAIVGESTQSCVSHLVKTQTQRLLILIDPRKILSGDEETAWQAFAPLATAADASAGPTNGAPGF